MYKTPVEIPSNIETLINPLPSRYLKPDITQFFGENGLSIYRDVYGWLGHNGIDIFAPFGTICVSMADSYLIESISRNTGYGLRVSTFTDLGNNYGFTLTYGHFWYTYIGYRRWIEPGNKIYGRIKKGQKIGRVDSTGNSTGNHLHITLKVWKKNNVGDWNLINIKNGYNGAINPLPYLQDHTMAKLLVDKSTTPPTYHISFPIGSPDELKGLGRNTGLVIPEKADGTIDFEKLAPTGEVKPL